ncbi:MAG: hypothetical protein M5U15_04425 [Kiritimatiellae bacterium]|nr:hypothetical protein [Kiritimatiellia bacterium]
MYKFRFLIVISCLVALAATGCFRQDHRTITISVPQLKSPECYAILQETLKSAQDIESTRPNYDERTLDVSYNALKLGIKNIEFVISNAGFSANDTEAAPEARAKLPEGCR